MLSQRCQRDAHSYNTHMVSS